MAEQRSVIITAIVLALVLAGAALYLLNLDSTDDNGEEVAVVEEGQVEDVVSGNTDDRDHRMEEQATATPAPTSTPDVAGDTSSRLTKGGLPTPTPTPVAPTAQTGAEHLVLAGAFASLISGMFGVRKYATKA